MPSYEVLFSAYKTLNTTCTLTLHFCKKEMFIHINACSEKKLFFLTKHIFTIHICIKNRLTDIFVDLERQLVDSVIPTLMLIIV